MENNYYRDDLKIDIAWLSGFGVPANESKAFILKLLNSFWVDK